MVPKHTAALAGAICLLSCSRGPDPGRIGVFVETNAGAVELAAYGSESTSDSFTEGLTEGFTFPQGQALPAAAVVRRIYINLPEAHVEESKLYVLPSLTARWHLQGHQERDPQPLATQLSKSDKGVYELTSDQLQGKTSGYVALLIKMPLGVPDRLYVIQLSETRSSSERVPGIPGSAALAAAIDRWLSRDALEFVRDGELFVAAPDGTAPRRLGPQGVRTASAPAKEALT